MQGTSILKAKFSSKEAAENAKIALNKETNTNKRFSSKIYIENNVLVVEIEGEDMVALRATTNSFLRYLQVIEQLDKGDLDG